MQNYLESEKEYLTLDSNEIARYIRSLRVDRKLSQLEIENICGFAFGTMSRIEKGKTNPTKETLIKIALLLKLSKDEIIRLFGIKLR